MRGAWTVGQATRLAPGSYTCSPLGVKVPVHSLFQNGKDKTAVESTIALKPTRHLTSGSRSIRFASGPTFSKGQRPPALLLSANPLRLPTLLFLNVPSHHGRRRHRLRRRATRKQPFLVRKKRNRLYHQKLTRYRTDICSRPLKQNGKTVASPLKPVQAWLRSPVSSSTIRTFSTTSRQRTAIRIRLCLPLGSILTSSESPTRPSHLS